MARHNNLSSYPEEWLDCRSLGHAWARKGVFAVRGKRPVVRVRVLQCARCGTRRKDRIDSAGVKIGTYYYNHPEGYRLKKMKRVEFTREQIRRVDVIIVPDLGAITDV
jgi:hypothetical protein